MKVVFRGLIFLYLTFFCKNVYVRAVADESMANYLRGCKQLENSSPMLRLKRHLFCEYDEEVRPVQSHQTVTNVSMKLLPLLVEFDEFGSTMTLHSWMTLSWTDGHLSWTPSDFSGIDTIHVKSVELWTPDLSVYNSGDLSLDQNGIPSTNCLVFHAGTVSCVPSVKHTVKCQTDFRYWPYDSHKCVINFGSWSHSGEEINFNLSEKGYSMDGFVNNTQWDLKVVKAQKVLKKFQCCPNDTYPIMTYEFKITRHPGLMHSTFVTPAIALFLLTVTVLWLDSRSTERLAIGSVNFICHLICIFDLHWQLPHNGTNPPNILLFYRDSLALAAFAFILTALLRKLQETNTEMPYWMSSATAFILTSRATRFLILRDDDESRLTTGGILANENEENTTVAPDSVKAGRRGAMENWRQLAAIIEWLSFFCVIFAYVIMFCILMPPA